LNALFEAQCTVAPDSGGGTDSDGDGVDDGADSDPNDPNKCGDHDRRGCHYLPRRTFNPNPRRGGGGPRQPVMRGKGRCYDPGPDRGPLIEMRRSGNAAREGRWRRLTKGSCQVAW